MSLLLTNNAYAVTKKFDVSCKGTHKIINHYNVVTESIFIEDLEITAFPPQEGLPKGLINGVSIIFSSDINGRYRDYYLTTAGGLKADSSGKSFSLSMNNVRLDDYLIKTYIGYLSLTSGAYTGNIKATWDNGHEYTYEWLAKCNGIQELYAFTSQKILNNKSNSLNKKSNSTIKKLLKKLY